MPTLALTNFNIVCATLGGFISLFGLVSYLFKEKFYLSEPRMPSLNNSQYLGVVLILQKLYLYWRASPFLTALASSDPWIMLLAPRKI